MEFFHQNHVFRNLTIFDTILFLGFFKVQCQRYLVIDNCRFYIFIILEFPKPLAFYDSYHIEQYCLIELSRIMEIFHIFAV